MFTIIFHRKFGCKEMSQTLLKLRYSCLSKNGTERKVVNRLDSEGPTEILNKSCFDFDSDGIMQEY